MSDKNNANNRPLAQDGWSVERSRTGNRGAENSGKLSNSNFTPSTPVNTTPKPASTSQKK